MHDPFRAVRAAKLDTAVNPRPSASIRFSLGCIEKKKKEIFSSQAPYRGKVRKVAEVIPDFFLEFLVDVLGFCIDLEGFHALVRQHAFHHGLFGRL